MSSIKEAALAPPQANIETAFKQLTLESGKATSSSEKKSNQKTSYHWSVVWNCLPLELLGEVLIHLAMIKGPAGQAAPEVCRSLRIKAWTARYDGQVLDSVGFALLENDHSVFRNVKLHFKSLTLTAFTNKTAKARGASKKMTLVHLLSHKITVEKLTLSELINKQKTTYSALPQSVLNSIVSLTWFNAPGKGPDHLVEETTFPNVRNLSIQGLGNFMKCNSKRSFCFPSLESIFIKILPLFPGQFHPDEEMDKTEPLCLDLFLQMNKIPKQIPINVIIEVDQRLLAAIPHMDKVNDARNRMFLLGMSSSKHVVNRKIFVYTNNTDSYGKQQLQYPITIEKLQLGNGW